MLARFVKEVLEPDDLNSQAIWRLISLAYLWSCFMKYTGTKRFSLPVSLYTYARIHTPVSSLTSCSTFSLYHFSLKSAGCHSPSQSTLVNCSHFTV